MRKLMAGTVSFSLVCALATACSSRPNSASLQGQDSYVSQDSKESSVSAIPATWFTGPARFNLLDFKGQPLAHHFFDVEPKLDKEERTVHFSVTTPENHPTEQSLDLSSGQLYLSRKYCVQSDAWKKYKGELYLPPYTAGVVPRVLDQLNRPQKIIVFGQGDDYREHYNTNYFEARIVGGYIEQECPDGSCSNKGEWLSRLVLIGVKKNDPRYGEITSVKNLMPLVDWRKVRAFVGNSSGKNEVGGHLYPSKRMGAVVGPVQAINFLEKNSHFFEVAELAKLRKGCHKLYDHIWTDFNEKEGPSFEKRFKQNEIKYRDRYNTCSKYVYPASINDNPKRKWFFTYLEAFNRLGEMGYYFSCKQKSWVSNPRLQGGKRLVALKDQFQFCSPGAFDSAMNQAVRLLELMKERARVSYRFIDYDNSPWGTHNKLYSWVKHDNKVLECSKNKDGKHFKNTLPTFPRDVRWQPLEVSEKKGR